MGTLIIIARNNTVSSCVENSGSVGPASGSLSDGSKLSRYGQIGELQGSNARMALSRPSASSGSRSLGCRLRLVAPVTRGTSGEHTVQANEGERARMEGYPISSSHRKAQSSQKMVRLDCFISRKLSCVVRSSRSYFRWQ